MGYQISEVIVTDQLVGDLESLLEGYSDKKIFILTDKTTQKHCWPLLNEVKSLKDAIHIVTEPGEENKSLEAVGKAWEILSDNHARRDSLLINLGGGMVCDLGGFIASTYKRGMNFVHIPTTLLAQVDASVGGKTGFNFRGVKNLIGVINQPEKVYLFADFLNTLSPNDLLSGYAEMLKNALIYSQSYLDELMTFDLMKGEYRNLLSLIRKSVGVKQDFVLKDPMERDIRKVLNFGHTLGHAFESFAMEIGKPIHHGIAVAYGIIGELFLSVQKKGFPHEKYLQISKYILNNYPEFSIFTGDYPALYQFMLHDKKNVNEGVNFTLLPDVGVYTIDNTCTREEIETALDQYGKLK
ncbi:MAG: 3-dehydroquinate synthase [Marinifilaceae bacterium]